MIKNVMREITPPVVLQLYRKARLKIRYWNELVPPEKLSFAVGGSFQRIGQEIFRILVDVGKLQPQEKVLDVGCGVGRVAVPLTKYLKGCYEGFDIVPSEIEWCQKEIARKHPQFHFHVADVYNKRYNPEGKFRAGEYRFPYANGEFDFVFLVSVFTHLLPDDMENYFAEIARVLKKDGRCLISYFLLNLESLKLIHANLSREHFKYGGGNYRTIDKDNPESGIAYPEDFVRGLYKGNGLEIVEPIHYGSWCGRKKFLTYQDVILAIKKEEGSVINDPGKSRA